MAKKPMKRMGVKGKPMEMRMLKAQYGTDLHYYIHQTARTLITPSVDDPMAAMRKAMADLETAMAVAGDHIKRVKAILK